jgi:DNA-binding protein H-NS
LATVVTSLQAMFHRLPLERTVPEHAMATLSELLAQKAELERLIADTQRVERAEAIAQIRQLMSQFGLNMADITGKAQTAARAPTAKVAPKFRDAATGQTWSGRGLQPNWLKAALANGKSLADFAI